MQWEPLKKEGKTTVLKTKNLLSFQQFFRENNVHCDLMNTLNSRFSSFCFAKIRESKLFQLPHSEDRMHIAYRKKGIVENKKKNRDLLCELLCFGPKQRKAKHKWYFKKTYSFLKLYNSHGSLSVAQNLKHHDRFEILD